MIVIVHFKISFDPYSTQLYRAQNDLNFQTCLPVNLNLNCLVSLLVCALYFILHVMISDLRPWAGTGLAYCGHNATCHNTVKIEAFEK